ncbi:MAG: radical SAM protein [Acidobacteria bacterium]|nr:MAG: radical SAM protein [Acidobacteriota bacterium]
MVDDGDVRRNSGGGTLFGPYEVEYGGRKYFGNVWMREFHTFRRADGIYLFVVDQMAVHKISEATARIIDKVSCSSGGLVPASMLEHLKVFDLVEEKDKPASRKAESNGKRDRAAGNKAELGVSTIALFVAQECNMRCVYCYGRGGKYAGGGTMRDETALRAVDWLMENSKSAEKVQIFFFGGEPLLNFPLIKKTVGYAKARASGFSKKITFGITTNGSLITDEIVSFMKDENIRPLISFDGTREIQNRQRPFRDGNGSYDTVYASVQKLRPVFPQLSGRATVYGDSDPCEIKDGMSRAGFTACFLTKASRVILDGEDATETADDEALSHRMIAFQQKEWIRLFQSITERRVEQGDPARSLVPLVTGQKRYFTCGVGKWFAAVSVSGDIYPCHRFVGQDDTRMGTIADYRADGLNEYHRSTVDALPQCSVCWARYLCGGGCAYENKSRTGDRRMSDALSCAEMRATLETGLALYARLDDDDREFLKDAYQSIVKDRLP